jgi:hypothetical protein
MFPRIHSLFLMLFLLMLLQQDYNFFALSAPSDTPSSHLKAMPVLSSSRKGSPPPPSAVAAAPAPTAPCPEPELSPHFSHYVAPDTQANDAPAKPKPVLSSSSRAAAAASAADSATAQPELSPHFNYYVAPETQATDAPVKQKPVLSSSSSSSTAAKQSTSQELSQGYPAKGKTTKDATKKATEAPSDELQEMVSDSALTIS